MSDTFTPHLSPRCNIADHFILPNLEQTRAERVVMTHGEENLTFGQLHRRANRFANALRRLGVRPGERVLLLMRESLDYPICFWGAIRAGVLPVPLNTVLLPADYRLFLADSQAAVLVLDATLYEAVSPALKNTEYPRHLVLAGASAAELPDSVPGALPLDALLAAEGDDFDALSASPEDAAFWLYSSGSTGRPRAAAHSQRAMAHVAANYMHQILRLNPDDLGFSAPKMFFAYGLGNSLYFPLASGSRALIHTGPATPEACFELLARHRPTVFYGVPSLFAAMLDRYEDWLEDRKHPPDQLPRLEHLRRVCSGGERLPPALLERWRRHFGQPILDGLGSTEALHFYLSNTPENWRTGSAGRPVPGYEIRLLDEHGAEAAQGQAGELWLRGPAVAANRAGALPDAADEAASGNSAGWLATGDRLTRDPDGFYFYEGRMDDMLKIGGSWVAPAEVEAVLLEHPAVAECAVTGISAPGGLTRAVAHVVPGHGAPPADADRKALVSALLAHAAEHLPRFKVPAEIRLAEALPRTATGKVRRFLLRENPAPVGPAVAPPPAG